MPDTCRAMQKLPSNDQDYDHKREHGNSRPRYAVLHDAGSISIVGTQEVQPHSSLIGGDLAAV